MILKNNTLLELYDTLVNSTISFSPYAESPVEKAFRECDDKLQKDIDIWRRFNAFLRSANTDLINENRKLKQDHESDVRTIGKLHSQMVNLEDEKTERETRADILKSQRDMVKKALDELKRDNKLLTESRDEWSKIAIENRKQITKLEKDISKLTDRTRAELEAKVKRMDEITKELVDTKIQLKFSKASNDDWKRRFDNAEKKIKELKATLEKTNVDRKVLQAEIEELKKKIQSLEDDIEFKALCRDGWRDRAEKAERQLEEKKQQSYADGYSDGNEEGQNELWEMLQLINDVKPFEAPYFEDVTSMNDIISWDLEDFKEAYDKWVENDKKALEEAKKQHVEYMRSYLERFCMGRLCYRCPLHTSTFKCSRGKWLGGISDKDVERYYNKVKETNQANLPRYFSSTVEAVFTTEAKINKDLLEKVCGVKSDEEAPHRLEYGDAVRLPWRDYDYMYIGSDEKEETFVRLFDPKNHAVVTTHGSNVRYNGGRILICEEDDIRKICKYMK